MITRRLFRLPLAIAVLLGAMPATGALAARASIDQQFVVLQGLDKITARVSEFEVQVGTVAEFGTLRLSVDACRVTPPEESPESAAFLEIEDLPPGADEAATIFTGWMFASSPALSAMEHPIYDVWVIGCSNAPRQQVAEGEGVAGEEGAVPVRVPLSEAGIIPPKLPPARAGR